MAATQRLPQRRRVRGAQPVAGSVASTNSNAFRPDPRFLIGEDAKEAYMEALKVRVEQVWKGWAANAKVRSTRTRSHHGATHGGQGAFENGFASERARYRYGY